MAKSIGKSDLIAHVAKQCKVEKTKAKAIVDTTIDVITSALKKGHKVQITGFGTFGVAHRKKRIGVNPQTGKKITISASRVPKFSAGKSLKDAVRK